MTTEIAGRLSDLVLVRLHRCAEAYAEAPAEVRDAIVAACRREATVHDLAERILQRTIYAQACSRLSPLRELVQNALDASPTGARIDVRSVGALGAGAVEVTFTDRGRGMTRAELLDDLLVPFRSGKEADPDAIGEHGIGFLSALEIAPRVEVVSATVASALRLVVEPASAGPPYSDFRFALADVDPRQRPPVGTTVRLRLERPIASAALAQEIAAVAGLVDPARARIFVNGEAINTARVRLRRAARVPIEGGLGELDLLVGRGDGIAPRFVVTQKGLLVIPNLEPFVAPERALHRELMRAMTAAGYGIVADLPLTVPLTKGRSAVAAICAPAVDDAILAAFERFVLEDALYDRELLRSVDHRLGAVLDRLVGAALTGEAPPLLATAPDGGPEADGPRAPTVAAPEGVVRFAGALVDAPLFIVAWVAPGEGEVRRACSLRIVMDAHRQGVLRPLATTRELLPGLVYLASADPLAEALLQRIAVPAPSAAALAPRAAAPRPVPRLARERLLASAADLPGARALAAAITILERIDGAVSAAVGLPPSALSVHQDLYGPDEMAHTDGAGISVNLASARIRALLGGVLTSDDPTAFGALVDLVLHEKAHVSLASFVPRSNAEHGAGFYRRKDQLRRRLLEAIAAGDVQDPILFVPIARNDLTSCELPSTEALAAAFSPEPLAA
jgi:hypothetical protein